MSRTIDKMLTQNNDNNKGKNDSYTYALVVVDQLGQLGQLKHAR